MTLPQGPFFVSKNLPSFSFYRENTKTFSRDLVCLHRNPSNFRLRGQNRKQKKDHWGSVMTTSSKNFSPIGPILHTKTLVTKLISREKTVFEKNVKYFFTMHF